MNNQLATIKTMPVSDIMTMAQTFAESGMFVDAKQMGQAFVKIQAGQEIGIPPFAAMSGIHIIQGKPTIGAGLIASTVKGSGKYDYSVLQLDDKACELEFFQGTKSLGKSKFTIEDAKKALTKNIDKFPKNMLFARAISNGVKWYCPDVFSGPVYTPEEMDTIDISHEVMPPATANVNTETGEVTLPLIPEARYKKLMTSLRADGANVIDILTQARTVFIFTADQEGEISKVVAESFSKDPVAA
jgi:hypothetical protein